MLDTTMDFLFFNTILIKKFKNTNHSRFEKSAREQKKTHYAHSQVLKFIIFVSRQVEQFHKEI